MVLSFNSQESLNFLLLVTIFIVLVVALPEVKLDLSPLIDAISHACFDLVHTDYNDTPGAVSSIL